MADNNLFVFKKANDGSFTEVIIAEGSANNVLTTNGSGTWTWAAPAVAENLALSAMPGDLSAVGIRTSLSKGETIAAGAPVYIGTDSKVYNADANGTGTYPARGVNLTSGVSGAPGDILLEGIYRNDTLYNFTINSPIYLGITAGAIQQTYPSGEDEAVQNLGWAVTADSWYVKPSLDYIIYKV
jgi:hypothetical protein